MGWECLDFTLLLSELTFVSRQMMDQHQMQMERERRTSGSAGRLRMPHHCEIWYETTYCAIKTHTHTCKTTTELPCRLYCILGQMLTLRNIKFPGRRIDPYSKQHILPILYHTHKLSFCFSTCLSINQFKTVVFHNAISSICEFCFGESHETCQEHVEIILLKEN